MSANILLIGNNTKYITIFVKNIFSMKNRALKKYCLYCDGEYTALRTDSKYCSASCRQMASRSKLNGGSGYRQNHNSLPRNERQNEIIPTNTITGVNQVSTHNNSSQLSVNNTSISEIKLITNHQPNVNEPLEKLKLEVEKMKFEVGLTKKYEAELMEREKKRLVGELQKLLTLNKNGETSLSRLRFIADTISGILITQKDIFTDNQESYDFLLLELVPKLKQYIRERKRNKQRGIEFVIEDSLKQQIQRTLEKT
jgi:hypothetical protein